MERTNALRDLLTNTTAQYSQGPRFTVEFDTKNATDGKTVLIAPNVRNLWGSAKAVSGANELRLMMDSLCHEVYHIRTTKFMTTAEYKSDYPHHPKVAHTIFNIVEDHYIDRKRLQEFRGLRRAHVLKTQLLMKNRYDSIADMDPADACLAGLVQMKWTGTAKGVQDAPDEVRAFLAHARSVMNRVERVDDAADRYDLSREITDRYVDMFPVNEDRLDLIDILTVITDGGEGGTTDPIDMDVSARPGESGEGEGENGDGAGMIQATIDGDGLDDLEAGDGSGVPASLQGQLDAMDALADQQNAADWVSDGQMDPDDDYVTPSDIDDWQYQKAQASANDHRLDQAIDKQRNNYRDALNRLNKAREQARRNNETTAEDVREELARTGLAREIEEAFYRLKTADFEYPDEEGDDVNLDAVARWRAGDSLETEFYYDTTRSATGNRAIGVTLDMSSSMDEDDVLQAKMALAAIAQATDIIGDTFLANTFQGRAPTKVITPPERPFDWADLDTVHARGNTPMAHGIADMAQMIERTMAQTSAVFVVTDGAPNVKLDSTSSSWGGTGAIDDCAALVAKLRQKGTVVIGIGIGSGARKHAMHRIFGSDGWLQTDIDRFADVLVDIYRQQLDVSSMPAGY